MLLKTSNKTALWSGMIVMFDDGMTGGGDGGEEGGCCCGGFCEWCGCEILYGSWYRVAVGFCFPFSLFLCVR